TGIFPPTEDPFGAVIPPLFCRPWVELVGAVELVPLVCVREPVPVMVIVPVVPVTGQPGQREEVPVVATVAHGVQPGLGSGSVPELEVVESVFDVAFAVCPAIACSEMRPVATRYAASNTVQTIE